MKKVNIVIMGKTGAGKSTLLNTVFGKPVAEVGNGGAITQENMIYSRTLDGMELNLYDTVGLELNSSLNDKTLADIRKRIKVSNDNSTFDDVNVVWYCVNPNTERFEDYEAHLINDLIYRFEVPFVIVLTQSYTKRKTSNMIENIASRFPSFNILPVLAEDMETDAGDIASYGVDELLKLSIDEYNTLKIKILDAKQADLDAKLAVMRAELKAKRTTAESAIEKQANIAFTLGCIPGVSLFSYQPTYIAAINGINEAFGLEMDSNTVGDIAALIVAGLVFTPFFAIPGASGWVAKEMITDECNKYLDTVITTFENSDYSEIKNNQLMCERIVAELKKRKKGK